MSKELEALKIISTIGLSHIEQSRDENYEGEWEYTEYEEDDGTVEENFPQEINTIKSALERKEKLEKVIEILKEKPTLAELDFKYSYEKQCKFYYVKYYEVYNREPEEKFYCTKEEYELLKEVLGR